MGFNIFATFSYKIVTTLNTLIIMPTGFKTSGSSFFLEKKMLPPSFNMVHLSQVREQLYVSLSLDRIQLPKPKGRLTIVKVSKYDLYAKLQNCKFNQTLWNSLVIIWFHLRVSLDQKKVKIIHLQASLLLVTWKIHNFWMSPFGSFYRFQNLNCI